MKKVYIIRHTTPAVPPGTCYGISDLDLIDSWQDEASSISDLITDMPDQIYSSPLRRCTQLASFLSDRVITTDSLIEMNFGKWEMQNWSRLPDHETAPFYADYVNTPPPEGESFAMLKDRVVGFWNSIIGYSEQNIGIVTHAGVIRAILSHLLDLPLKNSFSIELSYSSVILCTQTAKNLYNIRFLKT